MNMRLQPVTVTRAAAIAGIALALVAGGLAQDRTRRASPEYPRMYLFFTPDDTLKLDVHRLKELHASGTEIEAHVLAAAFDTLGSDLAKTERFAATLKQLEAILGEGKLDLSVVDRAGLDLARRFGIDKTPAIVYAPDAKHAHVAYGSQIDLKELTQCTSK
jgi:hypothetical protein